MENRNSFTGSTRNIPIFVTPVEPFVVWENLFTEEEIESIIDVGELGKFIKGRVGNDEYISGIRETDIVWIEPSEDSFWLFDKMAQLIAKVNHDKFQLDLVRFDGFQYSKYEEGSHYKWHVDNDILPREDNTYRKLSISVMLDDPEDYEGGELELATDGTQEEGGTRVLKLKKGSIVIFYSHVPHKVRPILKGTRRALVTWALGPKFV